jgi:type VI protein secretion system component VasF
MHAGNAPAPQRTLDLGLVRHVCGQLGEEHEVARLQRYVLSQAVDDARTIKPRC